MRAPRRRLGLPALRGLAALAVVIFHYTAGFDAGTTRVTLAAELLGTQDAVVIVTDHSNVDYALVLQHAKLVIDSRGVYREPRPNVVKA